MEGSTWLRFGAIGALLLGALYVLAPTLLVQDEVAVTETAAVVETEKALVAWFVAADGEADAATAEVVEARAKAVDARVNRVDVDGDRVVVHIKSGTIKDDLLGLVTRKGEVAVYDVADLAEVEGSAVRRPAEGTASLPLIPTVTPGADGDTLALDGAVPEDVEAVALLLDGDPVATAPVPEAGGTTTIAWLDPDDRSAAGILAGGELPEALTRWTPPVVDDVVEEALEDEEPKVVSWWEPLLPDTKINLGLDLQGGIDMTLQVDQDAAVYSATQRDARVLSDQAVKQGLEVVVRRDRTRPAVKVSSELPYDQLSDFVNEHLRDYAYLESVPEEGRTFHVWRMLPEIETQIRDQAVEQNLETLRKRVDATGVKEPSIVKMDGGRINIQLPGVVDAKQATDAIGTQATLSFRMVDMEADTIALDRAINAARDALPADQFDDLEIVNEWLKDNGHVAEDRTVRWMYDEKPDGSLERTLAMMLDDDVVLTGGDVDDASVGWDQQNIPRVLIDFKPRGANVFCEVTRENVGNQFAILLDDQIRSAPSIREAICGGSASIDMGTSADALKEANTLALVLRSGALTAPVDIGEIREIGSTLGRDAIVSGRNAALAGGFITLLFMGLWYGRPGLIADLALVLNVLLVFSLLALFGATLTLPGIAGVALTIGMAVDANIIIYERIREELKLGVTPRKAVDAGYDKGIVAVLDANITTAIAGVVLYSYGTGPIRGFAVTLLIGIFTTLVTALFVTRTFMEAMTRNSNARLRI